MSFSCFPSSFTVFERPFLFSNVLFLFSNILSSFIIAYSVVNRYVTTYINLIWLLTWGATNRDMSLFMKSRLWGCYKTRHVTKRDVLLLATLRFLWTVIFFSLDRMVTKNQILKTKCQPKFLLSFQFKKRRGQAVSSLFKLSKLKYFGSSWWSFRGTLDNYVDSFYRLGRF